MTDRPPNYLAAVLALVAEMQGVEGVFEIEINHHPDCDLIKRAGPCNCEPVVNAPKKIRLNS